ncbi:hypothetical protein MNEG_13474 [Monoraphidium neglectum]|uniref:Uncharacterized protein n=1 Tax=Monoraphidium neglectum TaxID=145388 RepID=A0A0D2KF32_9CHLO|nr:hypothetical protein MNEG_13474 [Monoraphidium neglectum]KIY94488.1 hypothetical protein MNEG_13474 [Monoraphidium neglectum]|eukprot:XP_013893508.1 hypothetical protein MNEG_13474 [Monoraphidium neglectum]
MQRSAGLEARLADDESAAALAACSCAELASDARARLEEASRGGDGGGAPSSKLEALAAGATRALARQQEELKGHRRRLEETARALREEAHRFEAEEQEAPAAACLAAADACDGSAARLLPLLKGLLEQLLLVETRVAELAADADLRLCGCAAAGAGAGAGALPELEPAAAIQALADREWRLANRAAALQNIAREEQEEACLLQWSGHVEGAKKCVAIAEACRERLLATQDLISRVQERRAALEGQQLALGVEEDLRCAAEEQARAARQPEPLTFATTRGRGWAAVSMWVTRTLLEEREQQLVARVQQLDGSARDEVRAPGRGRAASHKKAARLERRQKARCAVECAKRGDAYRAQQGRFERLLARVLEQKARLGA